MGPLSFVAGAEESKAIVLPLSRGERVLVAPAKTSPLRWRGRDHTVWQWPTHGPKQTSPGPGLLLLAQTSASQVLLARFIHLSAAARQPEWERSLQVTPSGPRLLEMAEGEKVAEAVLELERSRLQVSHAATRPTAGAGQGAT